MPSVRTKWASACEHMCARVETTCARVETTWRESQAKELQSKGYAVQEKRVTYLARSRQTWCVFSNRRTDITQSTCLSFNFVRCVLGAFAVAPLLIRHHDVALFVGCPCSPDASDPPPRYRVSSFATLKTRDKGGRKERE